jgi:hypothetical protein
LSLAPFLLLFGQQRLSNLEEIPMKTPALFAALALSLTTLIAHAGGPGEVPRKGEVVQQDEEEHGGSRVGIREGFRNIKRQLTHSNEGSQVRVRDHVSDAWRSRHRSTPYISLERTKDDKIMVVSCDAAIQRFVERKGCEPLSKRAFKPEELRGCESIAGENGHAAHRINKHLDRLLDSDMGYRNFHPLEHRESYAEFLSDCEKKIGKRAPARSAPRSAPVVKAPAKEVEPNPDFKPLESDSPALDLPVEAGKKL